MIYYVADTNSFREIPDDADPADYGVPKEAIKAPNDALTKVYVHTNGTFVEDLEVLEQNLLRAIDARAAEVLQNAEQQLLTTGKANKTKGSVAASQWINLSREIEEARISAKMEVLNANSGSAKVKAANVVWPTSSDSP